MTVGRNIYLLGYNEHLIDLYQQAINERSELHDKQPYVIVKGDKEQMNKDIQLIAYGETYDLSYLKEQLEKNTELKALIFTKPRDYQTFRGINELMLDYPLAVIAVAEQPIQPARIWDFLDRVESKTISYEWEEGDWDEF